MKKLYMIRHAKSSWSDITLDDFDRGLNKRGKESVKLMGSRLKERGVTPDIIISSPALRAKTTAEVIAKKIGYGKNTVFKDEIYEAEPETLHRILTQIDDKYNSAFLFGHNPGFNMLAEEYVGFEENIPTCGIVEIAFNCDSWENIGRDNAKLISFDYPKKER